MGSIDASQEIPSTKFDWQAAIKTKQAELTGKVPSEWLLSNEFVRSLNGTRMLELDIPRRSNILSDKEIEITEHYSAQILLEKLRQRTFTSLEVTTAFCKRACIAQQLVSTATCVEHLLRMKAIMFDGSLLR